MKITKNYLKQVIKEELLKFIFENNSADIPNPEFAGYAPASDTNDTDSLSYSPPKPEREGYYKVLANPEGPDIDEEIEGLEKDIKDLNIQMAKSTTDYGKEDIQKRINNSRKHIERLKAYKKEKDEKADRFRSLRQGRPPF